MYGVCVHDGQNKYLDWPTESLRVEGEPAKPGSATSVVVKGLRCDAQYKAQVAARCGGIWSKYSNFCREMKLNMLQTPQAPTLEPVNQTMLAVCWSAVPGAEMYDVIIDDGEVKHVNWQTNCLQKDIEGAKPGCGTSILVKGLKADVPYKAKVAMHQKGLWSDYSDYSPSIRLATQSLKRPREAECAICLNRSANVALDPCGHLCVCEGCADSLVDCPMCRSRIGKRLRVYS